LIPGCGDGFGHGEVYLVLVISGLVVAGGEEAGFAVFSQAKAFAFDAKDGGAVEETIDGGARTHIHRLDKFCRSTSNHEPMKAGMNRPEK
jgi:hypothetical protein